MDTQTTEAYAVIAIVVLILVCLVVYAWFMYSFFREKNAYYWIGVWNGYIEKITTKQNLMSDPSLPNSMQYADLSNLKSARKLHSLIYESHDQILSEVRALLKTGYNGFPMIELDEVQGSNLDNQKGWRPLWVKFIDSYAGTADSLPTLKSIVKKMGSEVVLLHVSVFWPGTELPYHTGVSKGVYRYHYGLDIPEGNTGLSLEGKPYKWRNREGVIWDDSLTHKAWNHTDQPRFIIFADLHRSLPFPYNSINRKVHRYITHTKHIQSIQAKLKEEAPPAVSVRTSV